MIPYKDIFIALHKRGIRYLVAGGFAVNFHRVNRATIDLDLILHLTPDNVTRFDRLMTELGYRPRLPVSGTDLGNAKIRKSWIEEKNMVVFTYINPQDPFELIDIFVEEPKPFDDMDREKLAVEAYGIIIPVLGLSDLLALKARAGRDKDLLDIKMLRERKDD